MNQFFVTPSSRLLSADNFFDHKRVLEQCFSLLFWYFYVLNFFPEKKKELLLIKIWTKKFNFKDPRDWKNHSMLSIGFKNGGKIPASLSLFCSFHNSIGNKVWISSGIRTHDLPIIDHPWMKWRSFISWNVGWQFWTLNICFFYWANPGIFFVCFRSFQKQYNFYNRSMWKNVMSTQCMAKGFKPTTSRTWVITHNHQTRAPAQLWIFVCQEIRLKWRKEFLYLWNEISSKWSSSGEKKNVEILEKEEKCWKTI